MTMGLVNAAKQIEAQGRNGDKNLVHMSDSEINTLDNMQGGPTFNPVTGLREYSFLSKLLPIVGAVGLNFIAPGLGTVIGAGLGSALGRGAQQLVEGKKFNLGQIAKSGLVGAAGAYAGQGLSGGGWNPMSGATALGGPPTLAAQNAIMASAVPDTGLAAASTEGLSELGTSTAEQVAKKAASGLGGTVSDFASKYAPQIGSSLALASLIKGKPATKPPEPFGMLPYDPNNVPSWMRRPSQQQQIAVSPMNTYQNYAPEQYSGMMGINQQMYADGGDVAPAGMGLPQSAAMPQLMSAAQFGYLNARTGGRIAGPGDGKSDDIPALLSNGEHVIDAATVSDLGNGDNDTGQKRLEEIKHKIRSSAGRKNPHKASPKQKGLGSLLNSARA